MIIRQTHRFILFFACILLLQLNVQAQEDQNATDQNYQPNTQSVNEQNNNDSNGLQVKKDNSDTNTEPNTQPQDMQNSPPTPQSPVKPEERPAIKDNPASANTNNNKTPFDFKNFGWTQSKAGSNNTSNMIDDSINKLMPPNSTHKFHLKDHINLTTLLALFGLIGTFMGIFSTWLIYHLNQKNNNPLIIDKKDSALKYIEELYKIKDFLMTDKIKKLDNLLNSSSIEELSNSKLHDLVALFSTYEKLNINISQILLIETHDRYKKHIKGNNYELFKSFISNYKIIQTEGMFYKDNDNLINYHNIQAGNFLNEENIRKIKTKTLCLLTFEDEINKVLNLLNKDLK